MNDDIKQKVAKWFEDKNLTVPIKQFFKLIEEYGELVKAITSDNIDEIKDAIGDMQVVIIGLGLMTNTSVPLFAKPYSPIDDVDMLLIALHDGLNDLGSYVSNCDVDKYSGSYRYILKLLHDIARLYNTTTRECLELAYDVIKHRTGKTVDGVFIKD